MIQGPPQNREPVWEKRWERGLKIQKAIDYSKSIGSPFEKSFGKGMFSWLYVSEESGASAIYDKSHEREAFDSYYFEKLNNETFLDVCQDLEEQYKPHLELLKGISKEELGKLPDRDLLMIFKKYKESLVEYFVPMWTVVIWEQVLERSLSAILKKYSLAQGIEEKSLLVLAITSSNYLAQEEYDLYRVSKAPEAEQAELLKRHAEKYAYIPMYDYDYDSYKLAYFEDRLREVEEDKVLQKQEDIKENSKKFDDFLRSGKFSEIDQKKLKVINKLFNQKDQRSYYRSIESFLAKKIYVELAMRLELSVSELLLLTDKEIESLILGETKKESIKIAARTKKNALVYENGAVKIYVDSEMEEFLKENVAKEKKSEIRGMSVSPGIASGPVRVIKTIQELNLVKDGDVLVTSMTRPDYVAAMKRCAAVVTDEGGMLCHAAIVSRELGIPCVVGTKNSTMMLHNGDLVEVDARMGIVRILG